jgi:hypothetical protein
MPLWLFKLGLPILRLINKNLYDKMAFFVAVIQKDTIAPQKGEMSFEVYLKEMNNLSD